MDKEQCWEAWAPADSKWSAWVKPVLFAAMRATPPPVTLPGFTGRGLADLPHRSVLVVDLPGVESVAAGLLLAARGWRPTPLFNGLPGPEAGAESPGAPAAVVETRPIMEALAAGATVLDGCRLQSNAPPAFLLDDRRQGARRPGEGEFDNRSVSFPSDFPSANTLLSAGLQSAVLIQATGGQPQPDLAHTLRRWQEAGIHLSLRRLDRPERLTPLLVDRPSRFRAFWHRAVVAMRLRPHLLGGYGGVPPGGSEGAAG